MQASPSSYISLASSSSKGLYPRLSLRMISESGDCAPIHLRTPPQVLNATPLTHDPATKKYVGKSDFCNIHDQLQEPYENDDALLHFDPHLRDQIRYQPTYITGNEIIYSDESDTRQVSIEGGKSQNLKAARTLPGYSDTSSVTKRNNKKTPKAKGKQRMVEDDDPPLDGDWEAQIKKHIIQDTALHLRILRFEVCGI